MARIRTIKPEFFRHEGLYLAEQEEQLPLRVAFAGLWTSADREGRFKWSPRALKLDCLPYDDIDFSRVLHALWTRGFIVRYSVNGAEYGAIPSWNLHQAVNNRERASELPKPNESNILTCPPRVGDASVTRLDPAPVEGKGKEGEREKKKDSEPSVLPTDVGDRSLKSKEPELPLDPKTADHQLFDRGKAVLGKSAGGMITDLKKHFAGNIALARAAIETASTKENPREYIGAVLRGKREDEPDKSNLIAGHWPQGI